MNKVLLGIIFLFASPSLFSQELFQYFDDKDPSSMFNSLPIDFGSDTANTWQVGKPDKMIFHKSATIPNALVTDTVNFYPANDSSSFSVIIEPDLFGWGIFALQWKQKLDFDAGADGGVIEFSPDKGVTWLSVFKSPLVYSFYGYKQENVDTLWNGEVGFTGTDTSWADIWLCLDRSWMGSLSDTVYFRFTVKTDSIEGNKEGWMIDNMMARITFIHTVKGEGQSEYLRVYPTVTTGLLNIEAEKLDEFHIIESMQLVNVEGKVVQRFGKAPTKYWVDIAGHNNGLYYLTVNTNLKSKTFPVFLVKKK